MRSKAIARHCNGASARGVCHRHDGQRPTACARAPERGVNPFVYWIVRAVLQPFFHLYFRLAAIGREHIPPTGP